MDIDEKNNLLEQLETLYQEALREGKQNLYTNWSDFVISIEMINDVFREFRMKNIDNSTLACSFEGEGGF